VSVEEGVMLCANAIASAFSCRRFVRAGLHGPLLVAVVAPGCSLLGWYLGSV
jgi:hypothetical protein